MKKIELPKCIASNCRANKKRYCVALLDNNFDGKVCPFFKKRAFEGDDSWKGLRNERAGTS